MNQKILRIAGVMQAHGIVPGMKVALTGINCTDYIALDMATDEFRQCRSAVS